MDINGKILAGIAALGFLLMVGCKQSMVISKVDYAQPIETVVTPDSTGMVEDVQHGLRFSILPIQYMETQDTTSVTTGQLRYIRGKSGLYYMTAPTYQHVYVMTPERGALKLEKRFRISEIGIDKPAFNQRQGYVQLVNRTTGERYKLTPGGMTAQEMTLSSNPETENK